MDAVATYQYEQLAAHGEIRILDVQPGDKADAIVCGLRHVALAGSDTKEYQVVRYEERETAWADKGRVSLCGPRDGHQLSVLSLGRSLALSSSSHVIYAYFCRVSGMIRSLAVSCPNLDYVSHCRRDWNCLGVMCSRPASITRQHQQHIVGLEYEYWYVTLQSISIYLIDTLRVSVATGLLPIDTLA